MEAVSENNDTPVKMATCLPWMLRCKSAGCGCYLPEEDAAENGPITEDQMFPSAPVNNYIAIPRVLEKGSGSRNLQLSKFSGAADGFIYKLPLVDSQGF